MFIDKKTKDFLYLFFYVLLVYITLPFGPNIWRALTNIIGRKWVLLLPFISTAIVGGAILFYLILYKKEKNWLTYLVFMAIGISYFLGMRMVELPAEKLHFLEYGGVSYFSLRLYSDKKRPYLMALPLVFLIGFIDEGIQYLLPNRFFQIHDVLTNFFGGILGLMLMRFVIRKQGVTNEEKK